MTVAVKICGLTRRDDVSAACAAGADFCGVVVEVPSSPRSVPRDHARQLFAVMTVPPVLVTKGKSLNELLELARNLNPAVVQLHGDEPPECIAALKHRLPCTVWKALPLPVTPSDAHLDALLRSAHAFLGAGVDAFVLDAATPQGFGGQGICPSWELATELVHRVEAPCFLAGGLTPDNVASAIAVVRPFGVDVSSGVEVTAGIKDPEKIRQFCRRAKGGKA